MKTFPSDEAVRDLAEELEAATVSPKDAVAGILLDPVDATVALNTFARLLFASQADIADELIGAAAALSVPK
jgi:hypothetical protein